MKSGLMLTFSIFTLCVLNRHKHWCVSISAGGKYYSDLFTSSNNLSRFRRTGWQNRKRVPDDVSSAGPPENLQVAQHPASTTWSYVLVFNLQAKDANAHWFPADWQLSRRSLWPCGCCCGWTMSCLWVWAPVCCQPPPPCWCSAQLKTLMTHSLSGQ